MCFTLFTLELILVLERGGIIICCRPTVTKHVYPPPLCFWVVLLSAISFTGWVVSKHLIHSAVDIAGKFRRVDGFVRRFSSSEA